MKIFRNILTLLAFISAVVSTEINAQGIDLRNKTETKPTSGDNNAINLGEKRNRKKRKKFRANQSEIKEAAETNLNARFRKKKSAASKKCKKKKMKTACKKKNALLDRKNK